MSKTIIFQIFTPPQVVKGEKNNMPTYKDEKTGKYYCKFYYVNWQGERKQKLKRGFDRQRDAKEWERVFLEQFARNPDISFESLYEKFKCFKENRIKKTTFSNQCFIIETHILPFFKGRIVSDVQPTDIIEWQNHILKQNFSGTYSKSINTCLRMLFNYAIKYLGLSKSPVIDPICKPKKRAVSFWTPEEYKTFSESIKDKIEAYTFFEILFYTGMRKGELLALTLEDVNFKSKTISINKTLVRLNGQYISQTPKTQKSIRVIDVPQFLLDEISAYISHLYEPVPQQRLFQRPFSWPCYTLNTTCKKIGLNPIRVHDFRHSHASLLIHLGANPLMIADRLGHENISMTMNIYAHLFQSHQEEILQKLESIKK